MLATSSTSSSRLLGIVQHQEHTACLQAVDDLLFRRAALFAAARQEKPDGLGNGCRHLFDVAEGRQIDPGHALRKATRRLLLVRHGQRQPRLAHAARANNCHQMHACRCQPCAQQFDLSLTPHHRCGRARQRRHADMACGRQGGSSARSCCCHCLLCGQRLAEAGRNEQFLSTCGDAQSISNLRHCCCAAGARVVIQPARHRAWADIQPLGQPRRRPILALQLLIEQAGKFRVAVHMQ